MYVNKLTLENYRNYQSLSLDLAKGTNILYGDNAQGKTNLVEAIFYTAIGKSFRGIADVDLVKAGEKTFTISVEIKDDITEKVWVRFGGKNEKSVRVNDLYLRKMGHLMGNVLAVIFSPEDLNLVNEGPSHRRKMLDIAISQVRKSHYFNLLQYNKVLEQKNNLLKNPKLVGDDSLIALLDIYNEQISQIGAEIELKRIKFIKLLQKYTAKIHANISGGEQIELSFESDCIPNISEYITNDDKDDKTITDELKNVIFTSINAKKQREIEKYQTLYGVHHDDMIITLGGENIKKFGSQGQKRTAVLSMKLAELEILRDITGRKPILLLDDVFSELDKKRQALLLESLDEYQSFITTTNIDDFPAKLLEKSNKIHIVLGTIK